MSKQKSKLLKSCLLSVACLAMVGAPVMNTAHAFMNETGKFYGDYASLEEAQVEAAKLGEELGEEGFVLMKNKNNALPLNGNEWVSVLGVKSDAVEGGNTTVADSLSNAGFRVNPELVNYYAGVGATIGAENVEAITDTAKSSMSIYNDVAVVTFARTGGESNDCATVINEVEDNKYGSVDQGWRHNALSTKDPSASSGNPGQNGPGGGPGGDSRAMPDSEEAVTEYKHYLQLTDSEESLLELAKESCEKVIVVINSSNVMELGNIQNDDEIDGIVWVGRPGADGLKALGSILNGSVNPSGKTVDIYPADLTADPTWYGYGKGEQYTDETHPETAFHTKDENGNYVPYERTNPNMQAQIPGVSTNYAFTMYSEDIYMGYRYYETADAEAKAGNYAGFNYDNAVVYPFGYGLSYTEFVWENVTPAANVADWSSKKTIDLQVKVTNVGDYAGKDVVQIYAHAPYTEGEVAKSEVSLVGFEKTSLLKPGQSEILTISVNVQDIASFDDRDLNNNGHKTYELDAGSGYELRMQSDSHNVKATQALSDLADDVILDKDDYSGSDVEALFSGKNEYNMLGWDPATKQTLVEEGKMTLLSRDNFAETFPDPMTAEEMYRSDEWFKFHEAYDAFNADVQTLYNENENATTEKEKEQNAPWTVYASEFAEGGAYADWEQAASHEADYSDVKIKIQQMTGVAADDDAWTAFMNQLTWDELVKIASNGGWGTPAIPSIDKDATSDNDSPNNLKSTYNWGDECHIASTWNKELAYKEGVIMGNLAIQVDTCWYGPAMNTHRSAFGGRCNEYYSQDGYQGGMIGAAVIQGAQSKGVVCYVKHCAMNDQEIYRMNLMTLATEQAAREIYFKQFQIAFQEGNCQALMTTYGSIGEISGATNYNFMTKLIREEWGFDGFAVTDAWMPCKDYWPLDMLVRAGCDVPLENAGARTDAYDPETMKEAYLLSGKYDAEKNQVLLKDGSVSYTQWYCVRTAAQHVLYTQANSNVVENGYDFSGFVGGKLADASQGVEYSASVGVKLEGCTKVAYTVTGGAIPAGLSLNETTGVISGTPEKAGEYAFTVTLRADNWIVHTANFNVTVAAAFSADNDLTKVEVGKDFDAYIISELVNPADYDTVTYVVTSGQLPAGITVNETDGLISGKATENGTFNFTVTITATKTTTTQGSSGPSTTVTKKVYYYDATMVVSGEVEEAKEIKDFTINENGELVVTYLDGTSKVLGNVVGADGAPGAPGADGAPGKDAEGFGCSSVVGSAFAVVTLAGAAFVALGKKRKND